MNPKTFKRRKNVKRKADPSYWIKRINRLQLSTNLNAWVSSVIWWEFCDKHRVIENPFLVTAWKQFKEKYVDHYSPYHQIPRDALLRSLADVGFLVTR